MSIYDNKTKIATPQEQQTYRIEKLTEIETYFQGV